MLYLIPAWYREGNWSEKEQYWHKQRTQTEFDDTVKEMQLFHRSHAVDYRILLLGYSPNLRHFLHRQGVLRAPYWSCFDAIQEIKKKKPTVFTYRDIKWPKNTEFIHTPYAVLAYLNGEKYAKIEFGEDGNPIQIDMYENNVISRRNIYDDRGFVSGTIVYRNGAPLYQDYLMGNGIWKLRSYFEDAHCVINPKYPNYCISYNDKEENHRFLQERYDSIEQVIEEVLGTYLSLTQEEDIFCVAMHRMHTPLISRVLKGRRTIASFFQNRYEIKHSGLMTQLLGQTGYVIADSEETTERIRQDYEGYLKNIMYMSPFDSRVDFGISNQLSVQNLLVPIDGLPEDTFLRLSEILCDYMTENRDVMVHLLSRRPEDNRNRRYKELAHRACVAWGAKTSKQTKVMRLYQRFLMDHCVTEISVSHCMKEQRILMDFREKPDLYLQIVALSMGIVQLVTTPTPYVRNRKNGRILKDTEELMETLRFYLKGMDNWNEAMVHSYEIGKEFSTGVLLKKWNEVIASFEGE